jgi:hypothetical protein
VNANIKSFRLLVHRLITVDLQSNPERGSFLSERAKSNLDCITAI